VADDHRLVVEPGDDRFVVGSDVANRFAGEHLRMGLGLLDGSPVSRRFP